jgi:hypothetical protein
MNKKKIPEESKKGKLALLTFLFFPKHLEVPNLSKAYQQACRKTVTKEDQIKSRSQVQGRWP